MARDLDAGAGGIGLPAPLWPSAFESVHEWLQHLEWQYQQIVGTPGGRDTRRPGIRLRGKQVLASQAKESDGRDSLFWHLVTTGKDPRRLDLGRGSRFGQVWHVLELFDAGDARVCWWRQGAGRRRRLFIAPVDFSLAVVLSEHSSSFTLHTAWPASQRSARRHLSNRAAAAWASGESQREEPPGLLQGGRVLTVRPPASGRHYHRQYTGWPLAWDNAPA